MADDLILSNDNLGPVFKVENPNYPLHPLCTAFPRASDEDHQEMCKWTRQIGGIFDNPLIIWEDPHRGSVEEILDGGNRQHVARVCGVPVEARKFIGDYQAARTLVLIKNLGRRHMTASQKGAMVMKLRPIDEDHGILVKDYRKATAETAGVSEHTIKKLEQIKGKGGDAALDRIIKGETTIRDEIEAADDDPTGRNVPPESRPEDPPEQMLDDDGTPVPPSLIEVFKIRLRFRDTRTQGKQFLDALRSLLRDPGAHGVSVEHERHLKELIADLDAKIPALVCCHCGGGGVSNSDISNRRWRMNGRDTDIGKCYCCLGRGYLLKDQPRPGPEWDVKKKAS